MNPSTPLAYRPQLTTFDATTDLNFELELSPSKARQHATTTQIWFEITTWLTKVLSLEHHPDPALSEAAKDSAHLKPFSMPLFEKNEDTMTALQQMMLTNMKANEVRSLLHQARLEELGRYEAAITESIDTESSGGSTANQAWELLTELESFFNSQPQRSRPTKANPSKNALTQLAESSNLLGTMPEPTTTTTSPTTTHLASILANTLIQTSTKTFSAKTQLQEILALQADLKRETALTEEATSSLEQRQQPPPTTSQSPLISTSASTTSNPPPRHHTYNDLNSLHSTTSQLTRETKLLTLKLNEYRNRISALERHNADLGTDSYESLLQEIRRREDKLESERNEVKVLEQRLGEYHGLVPDVDASRREVRRALAELEGWRGMREVLFRKLGED